MDSLINYLLLYKWIGWPSHLWVGKPSPRYVDSRYPPISSCRRQRATGQTEGDGLGWHPRTFTEVSALRPCPMTSGLRRVGPPRSALSGVSSRGGRARSPGALGPRGQASLAECLGSKGGGPRRSLGHGGGPTCPLRGQGRSHPKKGGAPPTLEPGPGQVSAWLAPFFSCPLRSQESLQEGRGPLALSGAVAQRGLSHSLRSAGSKGGDPAEAWATAGAQPAHSGVTVTRGPKWLS